MKKFYIQSSSSSLVIATYFKLSAQDHPCFKLLKGRCSANEEYEIDLYEAIDQPNNVKIGNMLP